MQREKNEKETKNCHNNKVWIFVEAACKLDVGEGTTERLRKEV
jgi:hypothetical protein